MYIKPLSAAFVLSILTANMALASQANIFAKAGQDPASVAAYWTPERMKNAIPMDMPLVDEKKVKKLSIDEFKQRLSDQEVMGSDGAPPSVKIDPNHTQVFQPDPIPISSLDVGTSNETFTSGQLTPQSASTTYPYSTVGKLFFTTPSGNKTCSGAVIRNRIVLTAGHCVHSGNGTSTGWFTNFMFVPAFNNGSAPFQSWSFTYVASTNAWVNSGGVVPNASDLGMLEIADQTINGTLRTIGSVSGFLGWQSASTTPNHAFILGYSNGFDGGQLMHQVAAGNGPVVAPNNAEYGSDMSIGASGSVWIQNFGNASSGQAGGTNAGRNRAIGTTSYGYSNPAILANGGSIFDSNFVSLLTFICNHQTGNC